MSQQTFNTLVSLSLTCNSIAVLIALRTLWIRRPRITGITE
jgi:hypothetical protein